MDKKIDYLFCNHEEAKTFCGSDNFEDLRDCAKTIFITNGVNPTIVLEEKQTYEIPAYEAKAVDTNGAGDMFAGSFLYALLQNHDLKSCAEFANYGASKVVETFGPRLSHEGYSDLLNNFKKS